MFVFVEGLGDSLSQLQLPSTASVSELRCAVACAAGAPRAGDVIVSAGGRPIVGSSLASAGVRAGDFIQARLRICGGAQTAVPGMAVSAQPPAAFGGPAGGASQGAGGATGAPSAGPAGSAALAGGGPTAPQRVALYVGDLAPAVNERTLHQLFSQVAPVQNVRVIRHHITRQSLGYAYVNLHSTADAERCIDMLNYSSLEGRPIRIMFSNRDPSKRRSGKGNLFIKGLPPSFNSKDLHDFFQGYGFGEVVSCKVALDEQGRSKCYGFVQFANDSDATQAIDKANGIRLEDHVITVERYRSKAERGAATAWNNVYVKDIPKDMGAEALKGMFSPYGEVHNAVVMTDAEQKSKGFGFVCFRDGKGARKAVMALHGKLLRDPEVPDAEVAGQESVEQYEKELEGALKGFRRELQAVDDPELAAQIIEEKRARAAGKPAPAAKEGPEEDEEEQKKAAPAAGAAGAAATGAAGPRKGRRTARTVTTAAAAATIGVPPEETTVIRPPRGYKRLYVGRALKNADRQRQKQARKEREREMRVKQLAGHSVYVRNLDESVDEDTLRAEFRRFGTLTSVKVMRDKTGRSRLFGYVGFTSAEDAMEAIRNMAGRLLYGKPLYVSLWQPREQRRAQIERARSVQMAQAEFMRQAQMMGADLSSPEVLQAAVNFSRIAMGGMPGMGMGMMPGFGMGMGMGGMMGGGFGMMGGMRGGQGFTQEQMAMMQQQQQAQAQAQAAAQQQAQAQAAAQQQAQAQQQGAQGQQQGVGFSGQAQQQGGMVGGPVVPQAPGIQASELAKLKPEEQRQQIGERLYHMLEPSQGPRTGKIVGMLLGMEVTELINLLESPDVLAEQVQQANAAIDQQSDGGSAAAKADPAKAGPQ